MGKKEESKPKLARAQPINEEIMKGVWVDGIGFGLSREYVILDGIITPPRSDKPYIISRMLFPPRLLDTLIKNLSAAIQKQKELKPSKVKLETKK